MFVYIEAQIPNLIRFSTNDVYERATKEQADNGDGVLCEDFKLINSQKFGLKIDFRVSQISTKMWHEARKQEKSIRTMMVDHRKRAERRRDYYEKIVRNF